MSNELFFAIFVTVVLAVLIQRKVKTQITLTTAILVAISWLVVGLGWAADKVSSSISIDLPNLNFLLFAIGLTAYLVWQGRVGGKDKGMRTVIVLMSALWLAVIFGWWTGEWSGILAVTMPGLIVLLAGLLALPPFLLPVKPLPWLWPTLGAVLYTLLWLGGVWSDWLTMNAIGFLAYLQGFFLIFRLAIPMERVKEELAITLFAHYGVIIFIIWRFLGGFGLTPLNLLIIIQGVLAISCYLLPQENRNKLWAWGAAILFGAVYFSAMQAGRVDYNATNVLVLFLGLLAFIRFTIPVAIAERADQFTVFVLFVVYALTWALGLAAETIEADFLSALVFAGGVGGILMPLLVKPSDNWQVFKAVITYGLGRNYPFKAVRGRDLITRAGGDPFAKGIMAGPGISLSDADHAIVVYGSGNFKRVEPPGLNFTYWGEEVREIVDLRPQLRAAPPIIAKTKDGIEIKVDVFTPFQFDLGERTLTLGAPFPYNEQAIHKAFHAQRIDQANTRPQGWDKLLRQTCERAMRDIIAEYTLDELCSLDEPDRNPRGEISSRMVQEVRARVKQWGLHLLGGGISNLMPPDDVIDKRIEHWKAHWENTIVAREAEAEAEEERQTDIARGEAQKEMLLQMTEGLEQLKDLGQEKQSEVIAMRLLEAVEQRVSGYRGLRSGLSFSSMLDSDEGSFLLDTLDRGEDDE